MSLKIQFVMVTILCVPILLMLILDQGYEHASIVDPSIPLHDSTYVKTLGFGNVWLVKENDFGWTFRERFFPGALLRLTLLGFGPLLLWALAHSTRWGWREYLSKSAVDESDGKRL